MPSDNHKHDHAQDHDHNHDQDHKHDHAGHSHAQAHSHDHGGGACCGSQAASSVVPAPPPSSAAGRSFQVSGLDCVEENLNVIGFVVDTKGRPDGRWQSETFHQWHGTVVTGSYGNALAVKNSTYIMWVNFRTVKGYNRAPFGWIWWPVENEIFRQFFYNL
jgi:hypothetical protein